MALRWVLNTLSTVASTLGTVPRCGFWLFALAALLPPTNATAQTLVGRVLEEGREIPVAGASISLVDGTGELRVTTISDSLGSFILTPPEAGEYVVEAVRLGYEITRSPLLSLALDGSVPFEIMIQPAPIGLEGFEVSVEREAEVLLQTHGHTPTSLGNRWIDRDDIERMPMPSGPLEVIRWRGLAGIYLPESSSTGTAELCVAFNRGRSFAGTFRCALILLNGSIISELEAQAINPDHIEAIAILTPVDASTFYGTRGGGGAVLIWTRSGRR